MSSETEKKIANTIKVIEPVAGMPARGVNPSVKLIDSAAEKDQARVAQKGYGTVKGKPFADGGSVTPAPTDFSQTPGFIPDDQFVSQEDAYGGAGETAKAFGEGALKGLTGFVGPMIEKGLGVKPEDIRGREEAHPIVQEAGELTGLGVGLLTDTGEAALMTKAGEAAKGASILKDVAEASPLVHRIGSSAIKGAAEMAVMQSNDEIAKRVLNDPSSSAESAVANIGLAAILGGAANAAGTGLVSPLWKATAGPKVEEFLSTLQSHLNGGTKATLPDAVSTALQDLGMEIDPVMKSALSGDPKAVQMFNELREAQHPEIIKQLKSLDETLQTRVSQSLGVPIEDLAHYSDLEQGHKLYDTFEKEYNAKYEPVAKLMKERDAKAAPIRVPDEERLQLTDELMDKAIRTVGTDSPYYKVYENAAHRILAKDTIGGLDQLKTELFKKAKTFGLDANEKSALFDIHKSIAEFQNNQIAKQMVGKEAGDVIGQRLAANEAYKNFADMSNQLSSHLNIGDFKGAGTLKERLSDANIAPEDLLKKFSPKGNAQSIDFLKQYFPETAARVQENEMRKLMSSSITKEGDSFSVNYEKLAKQIDKLQQGSPEYVKFAINPDAMKAIQSAKAISDAVPGIKSSGTAGWISKLFKHMPASAMSALGFLMGHNPISAYMIGEVAQRLGKDAPEAIKMALLRFMGSDQPIKAGAFKSMVEFTNAVYKGETVLNKAAAAMFKPGAQVLSEAAVPTMADRMGLDKLITKLSDNPTALAKAGDDNDNLGHYMPDHQTSLTEVSVRAAQYLQSLKPHDQQNNPLDMKVEPTPAQTARYYRALDTAQEPMILLKYAKEGTLLPTDLQDLQAMYPSLQPVIAKKISDAMADRHSNEESIPYRTRMGVSMLLGTPVDSTMTPQAIMAAQPAAVPPPQPQQKPTKSRKSSQSLGKSNKDYRTQSQEAEHDRSARD